MTSQVLRIIYAKTGPMIYIAHLDTIEMLLRALRRARIPYALSQGCHQRPKIHFGPPLPLGHIGFNEFFYVNLREEIDQSETGQNFTKQLPQGIHLQELAIVKKSDINLVTSQIQYRLRFRLGSEKAINLIRRYLSDPEWHFDSRRKGTIKIYKLGDAVQKITQSSSKGFPILEVDFLQGKPDVPSVSKVLTAVIEHLGDDKEELLSLERVKFLDLPFSFQAPT